MPINRSRHSKRPRMMLLVRCTLAVMALRMGGLADAQEHRNPNVLFVAVRAPRILPVTTLYRQLVQNVFARIGHLDIDEWSGESHQNGGAPHAATDAGIW